MAFDACTILDLLLSYHCQEIPICEKGGSILFIGALKKNSFEPFKLVFTHSAFGLLTLIGDHKRWDIEVIFLVFIFLGLLCLSIIFTLLDLILGSVQLELWLLSYVLHCCNTVGHHKKSFEAFFLTSLGILLAEMFASIVVPKRTDTICISFRKDIKMVGRAEAHENTSLVTQAGFIAWAYNVQAGTKTVF